MAKPRGEEVVSKDFWQKWDPCHIKMLCCVCRDYSHPTVWVSLQWLWQREEAGVLGRGTGTNKREEAQGIQREANSRVQMCGESSKAKAREGA